MKYVLRILLFCISYGTYAQQNLVPNPSFEEYFRCPGGSDHLMGNGINHFVYNWESAFIQKNFYILNVYFNACNNPNGGGVPINILGFQEAASGKAYAGIGSRDNEARNYLGTQLIKPMQKGRLYHVSFKINPADSSPFFMNKFGINFYTQPTIIDPGPERLFNFGAKAIYPNKAHIYSDSVLQFVTQWYTIEGDFLADSNYTYLILGNFWHLDSITTIRHFWSQPEIYTGSKRSYYLIDDVSVIEMKQLKASRQKICLGDSALLYKYKLNGSVYWKQGALTTDTLATTDSIWVAPTQTTTYYLYNQQHTLVDSVTIEVFAPPTQRILPFDTLICKQQNIMLNATYDGSVYQWSTGDTTPFIEVSERGAYSVKIGLNNCNVTETIMVDKCPSTLFVPNAFTPNGDGVNDEFKPAAVQLQAYQMNIYNRWGQLIFSTTAIENGWNGENSETGVYAYVITYTDNFNRQQSQTGTVSLIK